MHTRTPFRCAAGAVAAGLSLLVLPAGTAAAQTASAPAGAFADARGLIVDLVALTAVGVPGPLGGTPLDPNTFATSTHSCPPQTPAPDPDVLLDVPAAPAATARTVSASAKVDCSKPVATAVAQTEGATALINAGVPLIKADVLRAVANSDCTTAPNGNGSLFTGLQINGTPVPLGPLGVPEPNTRIEIPGLATVIVNEQHPTAGGRGIVVNAVHVIGASPLLRGDLIISHAVSGVVCPNGKGSEVADGLEKPDIAFEKTASPTTARAGDTVTYTATVTNTSQEPCDVLSFVDHLNPALTFTSTTGAFGTEAETVTRADGGQDVVLRPTDVELAAGQSAKQTIVVKIKDGTAPGTYFNNLELFCAVNGDFASGPLAPVTVPAAAPASPAAPAPDAPQAPDAPDAPPVEDGDPVAGELPRTGAAGSALLGTGALLLLAGGLGVRRLVRS